MDYSNAIQSVINASPVLGPVLVLVGIIGYFGLRLFGKISASHDLIVTKLTNGITGALDRQSVTLEKLTEATNAQTVALTRVFDKLDR